MTCLFQAVVFTDNRSIIRRNTLGRTDHGQRTPAANAQIQNGLQLQPCQISSAVSTVQIAKSLADDRLLPKYRLVARFPKMLKIAPWHTLKPTPLHQIVVQGSPVHAVARWYGQSGVIRFEWHEPSC